MHGERGNDWDRDSRPVREKLAFWERAAKRSMRGLGPLPMSRSFNSGTGFAFATGRAPREGAGVVEPPPKLNLGILNIFCELSGALEEFKWNLAKSFSSVNVCCGSGAGSYLSVCRVKQDGSGMERKGTFYKFAEGIRLFWRLLGNYGDEYSPFSGTFRAIFGAVEVAAKGFLLAAEFAVVFRILSRDAAIS